MQQERKVTQRDEPPAKTEPGPSELLCGVKRQNASHTSREVDCCKIPECKSLTGQNLPRHILLYSALIVPLKIDRRILRLLAEC